MVVLQVSESGEQLRRDGQQMVMTAYRQAAAPTLEVVAPAIAPSPVPPATPAASYPSEAYREGQLARQEWEVWSTALIGSNREGAEWWARVRSDKPLPSCASAPGFDHGDAVEGCSLARARLAPSDRRRRTETSYKAGWNNF